MKEAPIQDRARLQAAQLGWHLWRNNVGVLVDASGRPVRYGLANDSAALNKVLKSADLIGIRPVLITPDMVGSTIGQFASVECKREGWHLTPGDARGQAQDAWRKLVLQCGGYAVIHAGGVLA